MTVTERQDTPSADGPLVASRFPRWLFVGAGWVFVTIGAIGVVLPLLPATPFMLLAAACFARGSRRLHAWLLGSKVVGPTIRAWDETRTIPLRSKIAAITLIALLLGSAIVFLVPHPAVKVGLAVVGLVVIVGLVRIPTRPGAAPLESAARMNSVRDSVPDSPAT